MQNMNKKMLKIVYGDCTLGVSGDNFSYIFSYVYCTLGRITEFQYLGH